MRRALLAWFRKTARPLPWRKSKSPYEIWISEVMLQQTQVATVVPYYLRFLTVFPSVRRLAAAPLERVLKLWSGLGYYRRARHLHVAAQKIVREFGGRFPESYEQARSLPGIGDYTARAILSIAYNQPYAVVDGNVARVVSRLAAIAGGVDQSAFRNAVGAELQGLLSRRQPGNFNQAIMELGQTICLPRAPLCSRCPLAGWCRAYSSEATHAYPRPRRRRATELRYLATAVIRHVLRANKSQDAAKRDHGDPTPGVRPSANGDQQFALVRGLDEGLLGDLWNFPAAFGSSRGEAFARLQEKLRIASPFPLRWQHDPSSDIRKPLLRLHHGITYRSIEVDVYGADVTTPPGASGPIRWFPSRSLKNAAVSQLARKIAGSLMGHAGGSRP
jgi:A/G-specific adenine glycosylase